MQPHMNQILSVATVLVMVIFCIELKFTSGMELSRSFSGFRSRADTNSDITDVQRLSKSIDEPQVVERRTCNGFPCMYSHLGTKAGKASLYKTLAGFIDDCFNDPSCDPGRRKRQSTTATKLQKLMDTPLYKIVRWEMKNGD